MRYNRQDSYREIIMQFQINYGIGGGYNVHQSDVIEAVNQEEAVQIAYERACELFESYGVFDNQNPDYDSVDEEEANADYQHELESWVDYSAEPV